jgi:hypothetical protein
MMELNGQYIKLSEVNSVVPIGNMNKCRVTFKNGSTETISGYNELLNALYSLTTK